MIFKNEKLNHLSLFKKGYYTVKLEQDLKNADKWLVLLEFFCQEIM
jgi:hypothetical protein